MGKISKIKELKRGLSRELPWFNSGLYASFEDTMRHIQNLFKSGNTVHLLISSWYDIELKGDSIEIMDMGERCVIFNVIHNGCIVNTITFPSDKMYKFNPNGQYIEVIEGIDYSADEHCGDDFRVN